MYKIQIASKIQNAAAAAAELWILKWDIKYEYNKYWYLAKLTNRSPARPTFVLFEFGYYKLLVASKNRNSNSSRYRRRLLFLNLGSKRECFLRKNASAEIQVVNL